MNPHHAIRYLLVTTISILSCAISPALAQLPRIRLDAVLPAGGQAGTVVSVTIRGELSDAATELVFSHPDIEAIQQQEPASEFRVARRKANQFEVRIGERVPPGRYEVRALGPAGLSAPRSFVVNHLAHRTFDSNGNSRSQPFKMKVGEWVHAQTRGDQRDYYVFTAEQYRPLLVQVLADRIDSKMDAVLSVYQVGGRRLHKSRQSLSRDPILSFSPPADGDYILEISDATFQGNLSYAVEVSEVPWVEAVYPPVAQPGVETNLTVYGYNLPGGTPVSGFEHHGLLQSAELHFTPNFEEAAPLGNWVTRQSPSSARVPGGYFTLPDRYSLSPNVFLAQSEQPVLLETDSTQDAPQQITVPAEIAGQFFPRRDRDWFAFEAKKNQPLWLELATEQLGTPSDPALRIEQKRTQNGKPTYQTIATSDDVEGAPNNRDRRRFYTGTPDVSYRFNPPEDGVYVVSVADQYNATLDDPRLHYRFTVSAPQPDFQLVAFADPERFPDDKIARPNGVGILPGGSAVVRLRLLPRHGFSGSVTIHAEDLPAGVTSRPLILSPQQPEGLLIFEASRDAQPNVASPRIAGQGRVDDREIRRIARTAAIVWGQNNTDQAATTVRMTDDLQIAVLDIKSSPISLTPAEYTLRTCRGAKTPLAISLDRRDDFQDVEINVSAIQVPNGLKIDAAKSKTDKLEVVLQCTDAKLKPGRYSVILGSKLKDKRPKNPIRIAEASGDLDKVAALLASVESQQKTQQEASQKLAAIATATAKSVEAVRGRASEPRNKLTDNLQRQLQASQSLQTTLERAIAAPTDEQLQAEIATAEDRIAQLRNQRNDLQQQFGSLLAELNQVQAKLGSDQANAKQALDQLASTNKRLEAVKKEKEAAAKRLEEIRKSQIADAEFWVFAKAITVEIAALPIGLHANNVTAKQNTDVDIPFLVERQFGFVEQVTVDAELPSGMTSTPVVLGPGVDAGKLTVHIDQDVPVKKHSIQLRVKATFNGLDIHESPKSVSIDVTPKE